VGNELGDGVGGDDGVGVDTDVDLFIEAVERVVEAAALPPLGLVRTWTAGGDFRGISIASDFEGAVAGAIVDDDDVEVLVVGVEDGADVRTMTVSSRCRQG